MTTATMSSGRSGVKSPETRAYRKPWNVNSGSHSSSPPAAMKTSVCSLLMPTMLSNHVPSTASVSVCSITIRWPGTVLRRRSRTRPTSTWPKSTIVPSGVSITSRAGSSSTRRIGSPANGRSTSWSRPTSVDRHPLAVVETHTIPTDEDGAAVELLADEEVGIRPRADRAARIGARCHHLGRAVDVLQVQLPDRGRARSPLGARPGQAEPAGPPAVGEREAEHVLALDERVRHVVGLNRDPVLVRVGSRREHLIVGALAVHERRIDPTSGGVEPRTHELLPHDELLAKQLRRTQALLGRGARTEAADPVDDAPALDDGILLHGLDPRGDPVRGIQQRRVERGLRPRGPPAVGVAAAHSPAVRGVRGERVAGVRDERGLGALDHSSRPDRPTGCRDFQLVRVLGVFGDPREAGRTHPDADRRALVLHPQVSDRGHARPS